MASLKERRDSLNNEKFKPVKLFGFTVGTVRTENSYEVWYIPRANMVYLYYASDLNVPIMCMPISSFNRPQFTMSQFRWPESVMQVAVNKWRTLSSNERKMVSDALPLNTFMMEQMPAQFAQAL